MSYLGRNIVDRGEPQGILCQTSPGQPSWRLSYTLTQTSPPTLMVFPWFCCFPIVYSLDAAGPIYPRLWQCSRAEGVCRVLRAGSYAKGESCQLRNWNVCGGEEELCKGWLQGSWGRSISKIRGLTHPFAQKMEKKFLLFRAFQHGEEGVQSTTVYPRAPFQHLHVGYHVTLWCIPALGHPTASVWSWLFLQRKVKKKPPKNLSKKLVHQQASPQASPWPLTRGLWASLSHHIITEKAKRISFW